MWGKVSFTVKCAMQNTYLLKKIAYNIPLSSEFLSSLYFILNTNAIEKYNLKTASPVFQEKLNFLMYMLFMFLQLYINFC